ncbi:LOW QUALITY PROTEIN: B1 bradykinin receptor [Carettochelys insculpta]|uniref:LOW QUALITY PROTEIN: B1 bradykinin receptor n=1 Tax=Carettochelys insculpta TaxID=44489 RepID=UPI003EBFF49F
MVEVCLKNIFGMSVYLLHKSCLRVAKIYLINLKAADIVFLRCIPLSAENIRYKYNWPFSTFFLRVPTHLSRLTHHLELPHRSSCLRKHRRSRENNDTKAIIIIIPVVHTLLSCWNPHHTVVFLDFLLRMEVVKGRS